MPNFPIKRGDIVLVNLYGAMGTEKKNGKRDRPRPCLVIQNDAGNDVSPLTIVAPLTKTKQFKNLPVQVQVSAAELGTTDDGVVECGHIRTIDRDKRMLSHLGTLAAGAMQRVDAAIKLSLGLS